MGVWSSQRQDVEFQVKPPKQGTEAGQLHRHWVSSQLNGRKQVRTFSQTQRQEA